jgi:hypothetical protein
MNLHILLKGFNMNQPCTIEKPTVTPTENIKIGHYFPTVYGVVKDIALCGKKKGKTAIPARQYGNSVKICPECLWKYEHSYNGIPIS